MSTHYDVISIGSEAGWGTLARHPAPSGTKILIPERGGWLPREPENWSEEVFVKDHCVSRETWYEIIYRGAAFVALALAARAFLMVQVQTGKIVRPLAATWLGTNS